MQVSDQITLHHGDCLDVLKTLPDNSVHSIVTDPPYGLSFMGKKWDYDVPSSAIWVEALRVLKPGGHLLSFSGTRTYHRMVVAIEDAGFDIRDQIGWVYGSGFPKSHNLSGDWQGWGTALKPAWEPICVARKPFVGTVAANVLAHSTGALNIDASRVAGKLEGDPNRFSKTDGGSFASFSGIAPVVRAEGRWPANVIHDGSDEVMDLFAAFGERQPGGSHNKKRGESVHCMGQANATVHVGTADTGTAARFFYSAKASKADRAGSKHPTVKPISLMRYLVRLVTPEGGTVLDPFAGSGTTGQAAIDGGFNAILIERESEYCDDICSRLSSRVHGWKQTKREDV